MITRRQMKKENRRKAHMDLICMLDRYEEKLNLLTHKLLLVTRSGSVTVVTVIRLVNGMEVSATKLVTASLQHTSADYQKHNWAR